MQIGTKVLIKETGEIGTVYHTKMNGDPVSVKVGDKIVDVAEKTVVILTILLKIIQFIKSLIK
jgi:hypothetical protein